MSELQSCLSDDLEADSAAMPLAVYLLSAAVFATTTSEFMVAGIMPSLSTALDVSVGEVGYLI